MEQVTVIGMDADALKIQLCGDIDLGNAESFYQEVVAAYEEMPANVVFDCEKLDFIDSTTLGTFVKILKNVKSNGHSIRLCNLRPKIKKLFVICSLDKIITLE